MKSPLYFLTDTLEQKLGTRQEKNFLSGGRQRERSIRSHLAKNFSFHFTTDIWKPFFNTQRKNISSQGVGGGKGKITSSKLLNFHKPPYPPTLQRTLWNKNLAPGKKKNFSQGVAGGSGQSIATLQKNFLSLYNGHKLPETQVSAEENFCGASRIAGFGESTPQQVSRRGKMSSKRILVLW